jgi:hypothetical protein
MREIEGAKMYGKHFTSMYEGSMIGAGCHVFTTWGYVIAKTIAGRVELNPKLMAMLFGHCTPEDVERAIDYLCQPDPQSRNQDHEGRRLVKEGQFQYFVPSHEFYNKIRSEADRREYNRIKQREHRLRAKAATSTQIP